jgi:hypothetical protein
MEQWMAEHNWGKKDIKLAIKWAQETKCGTEIRRELKSNAYKSGSCSDIEEFFSILWTSTFISTFTKATTGAYEQPDETCPHPPNLPQNAV